MCDNLVIRSTSTRSTDLVSEYDVIFNIGDLSQQVIEVSRFVLFRTTCRNLISCVIRDIWRINRSVTCNLAWIIKYKTSTEVLVSLAPSNDFSHIGTFRSLTQKIRFSLFNCQFIVGQFNTRDGVFIKSCKGSSPELDYESIRVFCSGFHCEGITRFQDIALEVAISVQSLVDSFHYQRTTFRPTTRRSESHRCRSCRTCTGIQ